MTPDIAKKEVEFVAILIVAILIFVAGWTVEGWRKDAVIADLKRNAATAETAAANAVTVRLQIAQARSDALAAKVAAAENARDSQAQEMQHEINRLSRGRPCLSGAVVRVLNRAVPAGTDQGKATSQPVSADAAPGGNSADAGKADYATDTDVASWAATCRRSYDTCRGRLQAIADFFEDHPSE